MNAIQYSICDAATGLKAISSRHVKGDDVGLRTWYTTNIADYNNVGCGGQNGCD